MIWISYLHYIVNDIPWNIKLVYTVFVYEFSRYFREIHVPVILGYTLVYFNFIRHCHYLSVGRDSYHLFTIMIAIKDESQLKFFAKILKSKSKN